jgi:hypothetical protein
MLVATQFSLTSTFRSDDETTIREYTRWNGPRRRHSNFSRTVLPELPLLSLLHVIRQPGPHLTIAGKQGRVGEYLLLTQIAPTAEQVGPDQPLGARVWQTLPVITSDAVTTMCLVTLRAVPKVEVHTRQSDDILGHDPCPPISDHELRRYGTINAGAVRSSEPLPSSSTSLF